MKKQNYSKPFMVAEKFMPQNYCWVCYPINEQNGVWAPRKETNGIPGCQIQGVSPNYKDLGNPESIPADMEGHNFHGMKYLRCDPPVYYTEMTNNQGNTTAEIEAYYQGGIGGRFVWNCHQIAQDGGEVFYMLYDSFSDANYTNHS